MRCNRLRQRTGQPPLLTKYPGHRQLGYRMSATVDLFWSFRSPDNLRRAKCIRLDWPRRAEMPGVPHVNPLAP